MTSKLKSETARTNGAKSKGPKTPEGRAKSAKNSTKHGLTAVSTIVLDCECEDEFDELLADFVTMHLPVGAAEQDAVEQMAVARWHVRRISTATTAVIDVEMARRRPETEKQFPGADPGIHLGLALKALSDDSRSLALFSRYKSREQRAYDRAYKTLRELQAARKAEGGTGIPACAASSEIRDPKPTGPESHNPAHTTEPEPTPESGPHPKSHFGIQLLPNGSDSEYEISKQTQRPLIAPPIPRTTLASLPARCLSPMPRISLYTESHRCRG